MTYKNILLLLLWSSFGIISLYLIQGFSSKESLEISIIYLGVLIMLHGLLYFNLHGKSVISPTSLYLLFSSLLLGFAAIYINIDQKFIVSEGHFWGAFVSYYIQIYTFFIYLNKPFREVKFSTKTFILNNHYQKHWIVLFISVLLFVGLVLGFAGASLSLFEESSYYIVVILIVVMLVLYEKTLGIKKIMLVISLFFLYFTFVFDHFGRINLVTLLLALLMIISLKLNSLNIKVLISILFYPAIVIGSYLRSGNFTDIGSGVGSIISPFYRFGHLIDMYQNQLLSIKYGETIYSAFIVIVPRSLWEDKPWNFNRQITYIFAPEYVSAGHSEASVLYAEMLYNFGYLGFLLAIPLVGLLLKTLDSTFFNLISKNEWKNVELIKFVIIVVVASGFLNLIWGGFSTFINRDGLRILLIFFVFIVFFSIPKMFLVTSKIKGN